MKKHSFIGEWTEKAAQWVVPLHSFHQWGTRILSIYRQHGWCCCVSTWDGSCKTNPAIPCVCFAAFPVGELGPTLGAAEDLRLAAAHCRLDILLAGDLTKEINAKLPQTVWLTENTWQPSFLEGFYWHSLKINNMIPLWFCNSEVLTRCWT